MQTRSQSKNQNTIQNNKEEFKKIENEKKTELEFIYDFDYASECWRSNKKYIGNGGYKYMCQCVTKKGKICRRTALQGTMRCKIHIEMKY